MNTKIIFGLFLCGLWSVAESTIILAVGATAATTATAAATTLAALGVGALAVAKGALIGALITRGKRDVSGPEQDQTVEIALDIAQQIDTAGCVAKLLCKLEAIPEEQLSPNMATLKAAFGNPDDAGFHNFKTSRGVYDLAITFGGRLAKNDPKACDRLFDKCPLPDADLFNMLESTFSC